MAQYTGPANMAQRALKLQKQRELQLEENELKRKKLADELKVAKMDSKFSVHYDAVEADLKSNTVGLVTASEMRALSEKALKEREMQLARKNHLEEKEIEQAAKERKNLKLKQKQQIKTLSFNMEDEENSHDEEDETAKKETCSVASAASASAAASAMPPPPPPTPTTTTADDDDDDDLGLEPPTGKRKRFGKNPDVDTSFLPDIDRDEEENQLREKLRLEWVDRQKKLRDEDIKITFSYWDGSGHRKVIIMKKGNTIYQFLQKVLEMLRPDYPDLKVASADQLMYVKEDLIIPQTNTFYDFIVTKARGKSGPLFTFDVHDDVRLVNDASVEKQESHAGKVCLRSWYERNKHIFPAVRWEPYDPTKDYATYTTHDYLDKGPVLAKKNIIYLAPK